MQDEGPGRGGRRGRVQPVVAAVPPSNETVHRLALDLVPAIRPITATETAKLQALAQTLDPLFPERPRSA